MKLSEEKVKMLNLSERDIKDGKLIPHSQLDKNDLKWLKKMQSVDRSTFINT